MTVGGDAGKPIPRRGVRPRDKSSGENIGAARTAKRRPASAPEMGVTDCHVHVNPLWEMRPEARRLIEPHLAGGVVERYLTSAPEFLGYLDRVGVERAVLINYLSPKVIGYTERANDFVLEYAKADPSRLIPVGGVDPTGPDPAHDVERLVDRGIRGIKLHPPHQLFWPNAYRESNGNGLTELYGACERLEIPLIFHTGTSVFPGARNRYGEPLLLEDVAIDFPRLTIVLAHGGRPLWMNQATFMARRFPGVYLELSSIPPNRIPEYFPELDKIASKILFGTDWPGPGVKDIGENLTRFRALPLAPAIQEAALVENPQRVFPPRGKTSN